MIVSVTDDDDPVVTVSFKESSYSVAESDDNTTPGVFENQVIVTVTLSADPERTIIIPLTTTNGGGATGQGETDADYSGVPDTVTFDSGGQMEKTFTFSAAHDTDDDDDESVAIGFGDLPTDVLGGGGTTMVSIIDDDHPDVEVRFDADAYDVAEGDGVMVTVKLDKDPERTVMIPITTSDQGALPQDYSGVPVSMIVTFASGETEKSFPFNATQDSEDDDDESVIIGFNTSDPSWPSQVTTVAPDMTTVRIGDDDDPERRSQLQRDDVRSRRGQHGGGHADAQRRPRTHHHHPADNDQQGRRQRAGRNRRRLLGRAGHGDVRQRRRIGEVLHLQRDAGQRG